MSDAPTAPPHDLPTPPPASPWRSFRHRHPFVLGGVAVALLVLLAATVELVNRRRRYLAEIDRLRASMTTLERAKTDQIVASEANKLRVSLELLRRQAQIERALHLSITVDSGTMTLEREGALLREMPVQIGAERRVGVPPDTVHLAPPRGVRSVARVLGETDGWEIPAWVFTERGLPAPPERRIAGALGPAAILLDGGTIVYSLPASGPLADSSYVLPGAVRARAEDLRAILPNLTPGVRVYFY